VRQTDEGKRKKGLDLLKELKAKRGSVETFHKRIANDPDLMVAFNSQFENCYKNLTHLPRRYQELIMMAVGCARSAQTTINVHARLALENGATIEELGETLKLVFLLCGSIGLIPGVEVFDPMEIE
jgi:AhpD family alkylhydroperoxidase